MADLLKTGAEWLRDKLQAHASRSVTYRRGAYSVSLLATVGSSLLKIASGQYAEAQIVRTDRDYLIPAEDLILNGSQVEPADGDQIDDGVDSRRYEVASIQGEPSWRYSDNRRTTLRVHTKDLGAI